MSLFRRTRPEAADVERIKSEVARLSEQLERESQRRTKLEESLYRPATTPAPAAADEATAVAQAAAHPVEPVTVGGNPELAARLDAIAGQLTELDARVTSVSRELAAQVSELGGELDKVVGQQSDGPVDVAVIEGLRDGQSRLANEQARYQIAFREDLARLAEQLRRP